MPADFQDKFIAFVDILGFSALVADSEKTGAGLAPALDVVNALTAFDPNEGPNICPTSRRISPDMGFRRTQISDCVVMSVEVSPVAMLNLLMCCFGIVLRLMNMGHLCRGYITRGNIHHTDTQFIGTGYMEAVHNEKLVSVFKSKDLQQGVPFIELNKSVSEYIDSTDDACVKKMAGRITKSDGNATAIWPFDRLAKVPAAAITQGFNPVDFKAAIMRSIGFRTANLAQFEAAAAKATDPTIRAKINFYKSGLEGVIAALHAKERLIDEMIRTGRIPYGSTI